MFGRLGRIKEMSDKNFKLFMLCLFSIAAVASIIRGDLFCIAGNSMLVGIWENKFINIIKKERKKKWEQ